MTVTLYDYWRSSAAYRVRIALNLKGIAYRGVPVSLIDGEHREAAHLARNPQGLVPAVEIDGATLTQSLAIIEYLDETRPDSPLIPADPLGRCRVRAIASAIAMEIHAVCNLSVATHAAAVSGREGAMGEWMRHFIPRGLAGVEGLLTQAGTGTFCHGDAPTLADLCLIPQLYNAERWEVDLTPCPTIRRVADACAELDAFAAAHPDRVRPDSG